MYSAVTPENVLLPCSLVINGLLGVEKKRKHLKTLSNSTVTLIPKPLSFLASSTSKISPGLRSAAVTFLEFILCAVFAEEDSFI